MEQGPRRRSGSRPLCYTELNAAPCSLTHNGQVIKLASHVWRECQYKHITDKDQDQDLSGVLCTAWLVVSDLATPASPTSAPSKLSIRRLWLVNQHTCCVFSAAAAPMGDKMGVVHAWGPREQASEPAAALSTHSPVGSGQQQAAESASDSANRSAAGTQYRGLREGPCWELCTVCDVMAQLVDLSSGQELGLIKSEDKVVSAEVVFRWVDLIKVLLGLMLLALHLLATRPCQLLLAYAARSSSICVSAGAARLRHILCSVRCTASSWCTARVRPFASARDQAPQHAGPAPQPGVAVAAAAAATAVAGAAAAVPSQLSPASGSSSASQRSVRPSAGMDPAAAAAVEPGAAGFGVRPDAACAGSAAASTPASTGQQPRAVGGATEASSMSRTVPHQHASDTSPAAAASAEAPGQGSVVAPDLPGASSPAAVAAVQLPEWSGHVFACRGSMQSAVFCVAFATGLFAALLATGVVKVLADVYDALA